MRRVITMIAATTCLSACGGPTVPSTIDLLRKGDAGTCVAPDIEDTLRRLILPREDAATAQRYKITFDDTSMKRFDQPIAKMTCSTSVRIIGPMRPVVETETLDYTIVPSAKDATAFIVSGSTDELSDAIASEIGMVAARDADAAEETAKERMQALVKPGWLIGRWVIADQGTGTCIDGPYYEFVRGGRMNFGEASGRWKLAGFDLNIIGPGAAITGAVTAADATTFTMQDQGGAQTAFRRCTKEDLIGDEAVDAAEPVTSGTDGKTPASSEPVWDATSHRWLESVNQTG